MLSVPHPPYADTTGKPGEERWYAVATLSDVAVEAKVGPNWMEMDKLNLK